MRGRLLLSSLALLACTSASGARSSSPPVPSTAGVPLVGAHVRVELRVGDTSVAASRAAAVEGTLVGIDSGGLDLRDGDTPPRRIVRADVARIEVAAGRSRRRAAFGGYLVGVFVGLPSCANQRYECDTPAATGLLGALIGYLVGTQGWEEARLP